MKFLRIVAQAVSFILIALQLPVAIHAQSPLPVQPVEPVPHFRLEQTTVAGGAELLTIWGRAVSQGEGQLTEETPLLSVLRDTLGDDAPENDLLREVWVHTYTRPGLLQRAAAVVPFMYARVGNKPRVAASGVPPSIIDLSDTEREVWGRLFVSALKDIFVDGQLLNASANGYRRNAAEYRKTHIARALTILSMYESATGAAPALSATELREIQARLTLAEKPLGGLISENYLGRVQNKQETSVRDRRGHNWELLRQQAESEELYFEPLEMPDGSATHALLWVAAADLLKNQKRRYSGRFLNIKSPWGDKRLLRWTGYVETKYFDAENRSITADAEGARAVEMIPLAVYSLDVARIPLLLVDFRDRMNAGKRELSRRLFEDITRDVLSISRFGNLYYFLGRTIFDFVTGRRGMDINQPSRLNACAQLRLLLSLDPKIKPQLREQISKRLDGLAFNPLENDARAEGKLAHAQYRALLAYAQRPDGLPARLERERREEATKFSHSRRERAFLRLANVLTLGRYTHREKLTTAESRARLDTERQLTFHTRFLVEVAHSSPVVEVVREIEEVRRSLRFVAENGSANDDKAARALAKVFAHTQDEEAKQLCLTGLKMIANNTARAELLRIYHDRGVEERWRNLSAAYLKLPEYIGNAESR